MPKITLTMHANYRDAFTQEFAVNQEEKLLLENVGVISSITNDVMSHLAKVLETVHLICRTPSDQPCCEKFSGLALWVPESQCIEMRTCPYCGTPITDERRRSLLQGDAA